MVPVPTSTSTRPAGYDVGRRFQRGTDGPTADTVELSERNKLYTVTKSEFGLPDSSRGQNIPSYTVLRKNIYGSPLASKNWAKERNNFFLNKMPDIIGGKVIQMVYESCMFMIIIE